VEDAAVVELHGEKRGFVCPECGKVLKNEFGLRGHMRSHGVVDGGGEGTG
jgi:NAD-dependent SIR2 family protein deacetylase